jgi:hypothetical protein
MNNPSIDIPTFTLQNPKKVRVSEWELEKEIANCRRKQLNRMSVTYNIRDAQRTALHNFGFSAHSRNGASKERFIFSSCFSNAHFFRIGL